MAKDSVKEKKDIEKQIIDLFIDRFYNIFGWKYQLLELRESPDAVVLSERGKKVGIEITQLFSSQEEARYLLGKESYSEKIMQENDLIVALNHILIKKDEKYRDYSFEGPIMLVIRSATPDIDFEYLKINEEKLYIPQNYKNVWLLADSQDECNRWTNLIKLK